MPPSREISRQPENKRSRSSGTSAVAAPSSANSSFDAEDFSKSSGRRAVAVVSVALEVVSVAVEVLIVAESGADDRNWLCSGTSLFSVSSSFYTGAWTAAWMADWRDDVRYGAPVHAACS